MMSNSQFGEAGLTAQKRWTPPRWWGYGHPNSNNTNYGGRAALKSKGLPGRRFEKDLEEV
ncbi:hypothetical protein EYF80_033675 [Liparis tanakae]|uniref:Uncharacterized protein n=1 Tax=Liparis tanakae TaxID=230148 RepID=A0A4Z2GSM9_9TELE|nr:hypothetical protein EYF80_033675 [Liparis tanakae]